MHNLTIQGTNKTPAVDFNTNGELTIEGRSIPEDSIDFYTPLIEWVDEWMNNLPSAIRMTVKLEYINTSSSKLIFDLFKRLDEIHLSQKSDSEIIWLYDYDDDDSREEGQNYKSELNIPFTIKPF